MRRQTVEITPIPAAATIGRQNWSSVMKIILECVQPEDMRLEPYRQPGCGDWFFSTANGDLHIKVVGPDIFDHDEAFLCALHELIEAKLCFRAGVTQGAVDAFDKAFVGDGEPGDDPRAPYRRQHRAAMMIEHQTALFLGLWDYGEVL